MSETANIAEMALKISSEIFERFGWSRSEGPLDENFPCDRIDQHHTKVSKSHPVDCVFRYEDPYRMNANYLLTDLKSYAASTLESKQLNPVVRNLAAAIECAATSPEWRKKYVSSSDNDFTVHGLLFVYNHDNEYDGEFREKLGKVLPKELSLPPKSRIYVVGPEDIAYLLSVKTDFYRVQSENNLPNLDAISFYTRDQGIICFRRRNFKSS